MYPPLSDRVNYIGAYDSNETPFDTQGDILSLCVPARLMVNVVGLLLTLTRYDIYDQSINYDERDERIQYVYQMIADIGLCMDCQQVNNCLSSSTEYANVASTTLNIWKDDWSAGNAGLLAGYDGTPQSISTLAPDNASENSQLSVNRLCWAVRAFLTEYREKKLVEVRYALYATMALSGIALALTAATFGVFTLIGGIVVGSTVSAGIALSEALTALEDDAQFEALVCAMVQAAHLDTVTVANFDLWVQSLATVNIFGQLVDNDLDGSFDAYMSFVQWLAYAQQAVSEDFAEDCNCVDVVTVYATVTRGTVVSQDGNTFVVNPSTKQGDNYYYIDVAPLSPATCMRLVSVAKTGTSTLNRAAIGVCGNTNINYDFTGVWAVYAGDNGDLFQWRSSGNDWQLTVEFGEPI